MSLTIDSHLAQLEQLLAPHAATIGDDFAGYRNHAYRVIHFSRACGGDDEVSREKIVVAAAFHDLGIWTDDTFDYLDPSEVLARRYLEANGQASWVPEITAMIAEHHKITRHETEPHGLVEAFRRADWADVTKGVVAFGLPSTFLREVFSAFPNEGFHACLARLSWKRMRSHPFDPAPMMRL